MFSSDMVKNKGFLPSGPSEIHLQRNQIKAIINSLLPACNSQYPDSNAPFKADAIIANPPAYGKTLLKFSFFLNFIRLCLTISINNIDKLSLFLLLRM